MNNARVAGRVALKPLQIKVEVHALLSLPLALCRPKQKVDVIRISSSVQQSLRRVRTDALRPLLGKEFERIGKVDLDSLEETRWWYTEEVNLYFRSIEGREKNLVEEKVVPALETLLPCTFESIEWWPEGRKTEAPNGGDIEAQTSLKGLFKKWFGES